MPERTSVSGFAAGWEQYRPGGPAHWFRAGKYASRCRRAARGSVGELAAPNVPACGAWVRLLAGDLMRCAAMPEPHTGGRA